MERKYELTVDENIKIAKRNIVDYIWKSAQLEGINVTFPQTVAIYEKARVNNVDVIDILKITNLKRAWQIVFANVENEISLDLICKIHGEVARDEALEWGTLRTGSVFVSGTSYIPPIPDEEIANAILETTKSISSPTERSIELMLRLMKAQLFWDGNKRCSMLAANHEMIRNGCGVISVPSEHIEGFNEILCDYYTNDTLDKAKKFVYDNCIDGIVLNRAKSAPPLEQEVNKGLIPNLNAKKAIVKD